MNTMTLGQGQTFKMAGSAVLAVVLHIVIISLFIHNMYEEQREQLLPPPSVIMELSIDAQAEQLTELNIGQTQELSVASEAQESKTEEMEIPSVLINEQAEILVTKTDKKKSLPEPKKEQKENKVPKIKKIESDHSKASDAPVTSDAAALKKSERIAAQINSQSQSQLDEKRRWEALVLGQLNKFKRYPADAQKRNRMGSPVVKFEVDAQGYVLASSLAAKSGTQSLDREAQNVLSRAEPLPQPPADMLINGRVIVEMAIDFTINND
ncbi:MAG: energy transducer TonB family protein [Providencia sp.]|uniref:energy transducer TonB family protein n=1 Tax=Providencia sp. TaxID=589 RepID=UPI003F9DFAFE